MPALGRFYLLSLRSADRSPSTVVSCISGNIFYDRRRISPLPGQQYDTRGLALHHIGRDVHYNIAV